MSEHAQSTVDDARNWREVFRALVECGVDPADITPEWITQKLKRQMHFGVDFYASEYAGRCYEDVEYRR